MLAVVLWTRPRPAVPLNPLAIAPAEILSVSLDGVALAPGSAEYRAAVALPARLAAARVAPNPVNWVNVHVLRFALGDGGTLWVQAMRGGQGAWLRATGDAQGAAGVERAAGLRKLRLKAYRLPASALGPLLAAPDGVKTESRTPTELSTRTKGDGQHSSL